VSPLAIVAAYVVGAVPIGFLIARAFGIGDIRRHGSGTIGATNVLRTAGRTPAILTLLGDVAKGYVAVVVAARLGGDAPAVAAAGAVAAVVGNCWSVFLGFRGGKGVATGLGAFAVLEPLAALLALPVFGLTVAASQIASLGSVVGAASLAALTLVFRGKDAVAISAVLTAAMIVARHRSNLERIRAGTERRLDARGGPRA
jgi:glycerol-3-phosphate acyltransferase PlsY